MKDPNLSNPAETHPVNRSWVERNGFSQWGLTLIWIIVAFILFQVAAGAVAFTLYAATEGIGSDPDQILNSFMQNLDLLFIGNSFGQIVFLGLATWFISRLHTVKADHARFMRFSFHKSTPRNLLLGAVLIITAQPIVWLLSWINTQLPVPELFESMQNTQMQMIENYLKGDHNIWLTLFHIGLVPAVCEEVLYRSYSLRAFEKSWGIWTAIMVSGVLFGIYHLQLTNLLPLAFIGMLLAYVTYVSESVFPAMMAHLVNNGGSVLVASYFPDSPIAEFTPESLPPLMSIVLGIGATGWIVYILYHNREQLQRGATDA